MLKKLLLILTIMTTITMNFAFANSNFLNSVVLEKGDDGYNIILRSDNKAKVKKSFKSDDKITLTLNGITTSNDFNTMYKNTSEVNNIVVENTDANTVKIYIQAPDISKANIVFDTPNSAPIVVSDNFAAQKTIWTIISLGLLLIIMRSAKNIKTGNMLYDLHQQVIREREMEMYENFKQELKHKPKIYDNSNLPLRNRELKKYETLRTKTNTKQLTRI